jgi:hypothetical protein
MKTTLTCMLLALAATVAGAAGTNDAVRASLTLNGTPVLPAHGSAAGVWFYADRSSGAQALLTGHTPVPDSWRLTASLSSGDTWRVTLDSGLSPLGDLGFQTETLSGAALACQAETNGLTLSARAGAGAIRITGLTASGKPLALAPERRPFSREPVAGSPDPLPVIADALIEWDWRMQDGLGTPREPRTVAQAAERLLKRMSAAGMDKAAVDALRAGQPAATAGDAAWNAYWLAAHRLRRKLMLADRQLTGAPLLFVKHVPSVLSHQLTQVYGYCARPGGGLFVLEEPGVSMRTRDLTPASLPAGNFMTPELSYDAQKLLFAYCPVKEAPAAWGFNKHTQHLRYHIYELVLGTGAIRALTQGDTDNFSPVCLPGGDILFSSTLRGGYHRCGSGPCFVYTLARMGTNGENPHSISFHETNEWDPCLLHDGRVIYTRWDYVDRNAVLYQQLWTTHPDGSHTRIYYGNNTWNPAGIWEARAIPGSSRVMATAAPHHGMSAGSVILLDTNKGVDGKGPITRLTPEVRFPESESPLPRGPNPTKPFDFDTPPRGYWGSPLRDKGMEKTATEEENRWPGHCYKSPWPLSETHFFVSYSFDQLVGEAGPNIPNMFGLYFADAFGNKELIYRDPNISSLWARPLATRNPPNALPAGSVPADSAGTTGTYFLSDVMESWPPLPTNMTITHLRIIQVLLKTTPNSDSPPVGAGRGAPGRQVLGTVPVEADGSAYFEAPARTPMLFQALDAQGRAVQTMRSLVYLQPGEHDSCVGCHENRMGVTAPRAQAIALRRKPSRITPGPDGTKPFSYPRLVQPILDRHCVSCHDGTVTNRAILTGAPDRAFSKSFNALIGHVAYSGWDRPKNNYEPLTEPLRFGAIASPLTALLEKGHGKVTLTPAEWTRLYTWMDANGAFYGTFDVAEQKRQLAGETITAPRE